MVRQKRVAGLCGWCGVERPTDVLPSRSLGPCGCDGRDREVWCGCRSALFSEAELHTAVIFVSWLTSCKYIKVFLRYRITSAYILLQLSNNYISVQTNSPFKNGKTRFPWLLSSGDNVLFSCPPDLYLRNREQCVILLVRSMWMSAQTLPDVSRSTTLPLRAKVLWLPLVLGCPLTWCCSLSLTG